jgi:hypothetical protein
VKNHSRVAHRTQLLVLSRHATVPFALSDLRRTIPSTHSQISAVRPSISVIGDCRAKVRPDPPPPAIGSEGVAVCSGALSFASYDAMLDHRRDAWNWLVDQHWRIMFIGLRDWEWILITASYNRYTGATMQESLLGNTSTRPVLMLAAACILPKRYPG